MLLNKLKKLFTLTLLLPALAFAREEINILWGFSIASSQANVLRLMVEEANKAQDKYLFIFSGKPGAGGTIAANAVAANSENTLVGMSSSFFIRPFFEKNEPTHNLDNYKPILVQALNSPMVFISSKYSSLSDALKNDKLTIGVSGVGSISHLAANEVLVYNPNAVIVNFRSMVDASLAAAGGHVDVAVVLYGDAKNLVTVGKVVPIAYTGNKDLFGFKNKKLSNYGFSVESNNIAANYAIFASKAMSPARFSEIQQILASVHKKQIVIDSHKDDLVEHVMFTQAETDNWYRSQQVFWKRKVESLKPIH